MNTPDDRVTPEDLAVMPASPSGAEAASHAQSAAAEVREHPQPGVHSANFRFPNEFLWGAATSAQQVEGGNTRQRLGGLGARGPVPSSGAACDHYHRFREDFDLAASLAHNAHRFSLEWSRIEPEEGRFSDEALAHYGDVLEALAARGITPVVTLLHYTLPRWLAAQGGWENRDFERHYLRYVTRVMRRIRRATRAGGSR